MNRIMWIKLTNEVIQLGDFWASEDPNQMERQDEDGFNLQMQAVHPNAFGHKADENHSSVNLGNGAYYRPVGIVITTPDYLNTQFTGNSTTPLRC